MVGKLSAEDTRASVSCSVSMIAAGDVSVASCEIVLLLSFEVSTSSVGAVSTGGVKLSDKFVERSGVNSAPVSISEVGLVLFVSGSGDAC